MRKRQAARIFVGLSLLLAPLGAIAQTASTVFERVKDSVFVVKVLDAKGAQMALGSAVLLPSGKFATNYHVVKEGVSYQIGRGEGFKVATYFAGDSSKDICLLEAPSISGKPVVLGKAAGLKVGQPVYAVGAPQGLELSLSEGIVSQLRGVSPPIIQTTAAISPGSSGGGLFDSEGRLVGLTTLYVESAQNLNFAVPVEWIAEVKQGVELAPQERSRAAWMAHAQGLSDQEDMEAMRDWCLAWTKSDPAYSPAWGFLAAAFIGSKNYGSAAEAYRQALRISPASADWLCGLGACYRALKRYSEAVEALRQAVRINPNDAFAWYELGYAYNGLQQYSDAVEAFRQLVRIKSEDAKA